jgi:hypothetical protein
VDDGGAYITQLRIYSKNEQEKYVEVLRRDVDPYTISYVAADIKEEVLTVFHLKSYSSYTFVARVKNIIGRFVCLSLALNWTPIIVLFYCRFQLPKSPLGIRSRLTHLPCYAPDTLPICRIRRWLEACMVVGA